MWAFRENLEDIHDIDVSHGILIVELWGAINVEEIRRLGWDD